MATSPVAGRRARPKPPAGTLVLFVRHGVTPTTGQVLPGRAPGLHLAEQGHAQAEATAERLAAWSFASSTTPSPNGNKPSTGAKASTGAKPTPGGSPTPRAEPTPGGSPTPRAGAKPGSQAKSAEPRIAAIYASPLERTRETAAPIARRLGLKVKLERGLLECDFGEWTGAELKALMKLPEWTTVQRYPSGFRFPGGESFAGMNARLTDTIGELCRRHPGQAIVAVSHADPIKVAVADALGTHLDLFQRIVISPCSVTAISYHPSGPAVLTVNSTGDLRDLTG